MEINYENTKKESQNIETTTLGFVFSSMWLYQPQLFYLYQEDVISAGVLPMVCVHECLVLAQIKGIGTGCLVTPSSHQGGGSQPCLLGRGVFFLI